MSKWWMHHEITGIDSDALSWLSFHGLLGIRLGGSKEEFRSNLPSQ